MDIFSDLLAGSSSSPNAAVLEQIQKLSTQIVALQNDVNAQFIRVDSTLNTILANLSSDFSQLSADSHAIQVGLLDLQTQLNQLAVYNSAYQQAEENDALMLSINGCLNYQANHNGQDIGQVPGLYNSCENSFYTWSTANALDAVWAPTPTNYTNGSIYNTFEDFSNSQIPGCSAGCATPFAVDVNYLAQFPAQNLGLPALSSEVLANPND